MGPKIKLHDVLSGAHNALLIFGIVSHTTGIKPSSEISQT